MSRSRQYTRKELETLRRADLQTLYKVWIPPARCRDLEYRSAVGRGEELMYRFTDYVEPISGPML